MKTKTVSLKGKEYAEVKVRVRQFREDCPNGLIETDFTLNNDTITFKARILKDKKDLASAEATGHALGKNTGEKVFEKLETIAVGRALALLGYGSDGEIASSEEMEEFLEQKKTKEEQALAEHRIRLESVGSIDELKIVWSSLPVEAKTALESIKNQIKARYENVKVSG